MNKKTLLDLIGPAFLCHEINCKPVEQIISDLADNIMKAYEQPDISEDVETDMISDALKFVSDELGDEVELRKMIDNWCVDKLGNNSEAMDKADKMFTAARDVFYSQQPIPTVDECAACGRKVNHCVCP